MKLQRKAYLRFYGRPGIIWDLLREAVRNREVLRASFNKLKMLSLARPDPTTLRPCIRGNWRADARCFEFREQQNGEA